jgi:hypothetical protein
VEVDLGLSTHAHFDHDALHRLRASTLLDRLVGRYEFADVAITGIADKHVSDTAHADVDWAGLTRKLTPMETRPPDNWRSFDNTLLLIETAGLRILHLGDNRVSFTRRLRHLQISTTFATRSWHWVPKFSGSGATTKIRCAPGMLPFNCYRCPPDSRGSADSRASLRFPSQRCLCPMSGLHDHDRSVGR